MKTAIVLTVSPRLKGVLPPLTDEQRERLEQNIVDDREITDPICYWHDGTDNVIVDGMNRFEIAETHDMGYDVREMSFTDYDAVELWMLERQAGKRNLTPTQLSEVRGRLYNKMKASKADNLPDADLPKDQIDTLAKTQGKSTKADKTTAEVVAEQFDVSPATVKRDAKRISIIDNLSEGVKSSLGKAAHEASMADLQKFAKLDDGAQQIVARAVRVGQVKSLKDALKLAPASKAAEPEQSAKKTKSSKPPVSGPDTQALYKEWDRAIGPLVRLVDRIAGQVNGKRGEYHKTVQEHLNAATEGMMQWMGVGK